ncbi:COPII-coated vesicle protein [Komagataella phaffii CBS 7435]|uniref:COPII-coated vesicle protein n=1 Tax=Komagataella phaffii (strain ATCC 76273 / CBS 7435 / CECT 11047 / NRRL Y-11430 / Wegner 21-1) TaxID=981350 RepID=F2QTG9_KOMPC|nr:COPII-coated vesicle protein [Komagataella phaffii CBS 7435]
MSYRPQFQQNQGGPPYQHLGAPYQSYSTQQPSPNSLNGFFNQFETISNKIEEIVDKYTKPLKPFMPAIARFFIVATFYEDSLRLVGQWTEQVYYLHVYRRYWGWFVKLFLTTNIIVMLVGSTLLIARKRSEIASSFLVAVVFSKEFVIGGLLLAFSDSIVRDKRNLSMPGLPLMEHKDNKKYFLLAGRIMLILLFATFAFNSNWSLGRILVVLVGFITSISIVVGYKTKFAAIVLTLMLMTYNVIVNHYWSFGYKDSRRDFLKYEFFQTLSIVGGLLIIVSTGAGELSFDEKKKIY